MFKFYTEAAFCSKIKNVRIVYYTITEIHTQYFSGKTGFIIEIIFIRIGPNLWFFAMALANISGQIFQFCSIFRLDIYINGEHISAKLHKKYVKFDSRVLKTGKYNFMGSNC